jgi:hypothetical protein
MSSYIYHGEPGSRVFGVLPDDDYSYIVAECGTPYQKDTGNFVLGIKLAIQPSGAIVWANPWTGIDRNGEQRDGIAEFLISCNRAPKPGTEPDWKRVVGASGRLRLKTEVAKQGSLAGKEVNRVAWFHAPKQVGPSADSPRQSYSEEEFGKASAETVKKVGGKGADLDVGPDDIPF